MGSLVLEDIHHFYGQQCALEDVSVSFHDHKVTAILGRSGSGKSTLLQIINGMIRPSKGNVIFLGNDFDYAKANQWRLRMGYVVQGVGLFPHFTVEQNILISTRIQDLADLNAVERMDSLMNKMNLPLSFKKKYPYELSGGEQQRVGICRALLHNPSLLLMDEPLGALDSITRNDIQNEIRQLQQTEKRTIVMVTHNPQEAIVLADYILIMERGKVLQYDTKENVLNYPVNELAERLIHIS
jgi:osmoprotectant transport system ATP-binding protein